MVNKFHKLCVASITAVVITVSMPVASADPRVISGNDRHLSASSIEARRAQTLQIRKLPNNPFDAPKPGAKPYGGVEALTFRLSKVKDVDVTTDEGREEAKKYTISRARANGFIETREQVTNAQGIAEFRDLGPGLYLIEESAPDDDHDWRLSSPRLVILPLGDVKGENYSYENVLVTKPDPETPPTKPHSPGSPPDTPDTPSTPPMKPPSTPTEETSTPRGMPDTPHETLDKSGDSEKKQNGSDRDRNKVLAMTGANVLWAFALGLGLIAIGILLVWRRKNEPKA